MLRNLFQHNHTHAPTQQPPQQPQPQHHPRLSLAAAAFVASAALVVVLAPPPPPASAHIPLGGEGSPLFAAPQVARQRQQREDLVRLFEGSSLQPRRQQLQQQGRPAAPAPTTTPRATARPKTAASAPVARRAQDALARLRAAEAAVDAGDYAAAERHYRAVVREHGDLALSEYARFGAALLAYERGDATSAIAGLQDSCQALRGRAEAHAALAAVLYAERPAQLSRAELEFEVASEFDSRFGDAAWVARERHWPPKAVGALRRFLSLA